MRSELRPLRSALGLRRTSARGGGLFRGAVGELEIVAGLTGMGLAAGAAGARKILDVAAPDHLVVVGIAGGIGGSVAVGDLVVPERVLDLATGASFTPAPLGDRRARGVLASSDALLAAPGEADALAARAVIAIDMETAAIAAVCRERDCPWSVFRAISDRADDGSTDPAVLGLANRDGSPNPTALIRFVLERPGRIPQLLRLAKGANLAARVAADAVVAALTAR